MIFPEVFWDNRYTIMLVDIANRIKNHGENIIQGEGINSPLLDEIIMSINIISKSRNRYISLLERGWFGINASSVVFFFGSKRKNNGIMKDIIEVRGVILNR